MKGNLPGDCPSLCPRDTRKMSGTVALVPCAILHQLRLHVGTVRLAFARTAPKSLGCGTACDGKDSSIKTIAPFCVKPG